MTLQVGALSNSKPGLKTRARAEGVDRETEGPPVVLTAQVIISSALPAG